MMREADLPYHSLNYREYRRAGSLASYCKEMGLTHIERLPITEHPFFAVGVPDDGLLRRDQPLRHAS